MPTREAQRKTWRERPPRPRKASAGRSRREPARTLWKDAGTRRTSKVASSSTQALQMVLACGPRVSVWAYISVYLNYNNEASPREDAVYAARARRWRARRRNTFYRSQQRQMILRLRRGLPRRENSSARLGDDSGYGQVCECVDSASGEIAASEWPFARDGR